MLGKQLISLMVLAVFCFADHEHMVPESSNSSAENGRRVDSHVQLKIDKDAWTLSLPGQTLLEYCPKVDHGYMVPAMKPYVKRLYTPGGVQVLRDSPADHKHHHGLMFALGVDGVDFWGEAAGAGKQMPQDKEGSAGSVAASAQRGFTQYLDWVDAHGKKLLNEKRVIAVAAPQPPHPVTLVTWMTELRPAEGVASVKFDGHHYYGLGMRFLKSMDSGGRFFNAAGVPGEIVRGSERLAPAKWCAYTAKAGAAGAPARGSRVDKPVTVAIFDHPANPRYPNKMFTMSPPFAYLSATLNLWKEPLVLKAGEKLKLRYAVALWDGEITADQVESLYRTWADAK